MNIFEVLGLQLLRHTLKKLGIIIWTLEIYLTNHVSRIIAVITPPDLFTCCIVMLPMAGLYEQSVLIVEKATK